MARAEWSALSGDEVETVLSNLLYNSDERAVRVRPSQGDYGIDVIVPAAADPQKWDVYQIKKFAQKLDTNQKGQIEKSFRRVLVALVRRGVPLNDWYLVTPSTPHWTTSSTGSTRSPRRRSRHWPTMKRSSSTTLSCNRSGPGLSRPDE